MKTIIAIAVYLYLVYCTIIFVFKGYSASASVYDVVGYTMANFALIGLMYILGIILLKIIQGEVE
jgi:hypothetical protein